MVFWRKKKNQTEQEQEEKVERLIHRPSDPSLEPPVEYDPGLDPELAHELTETEVEVIDDLEEIPAPSHDSPLFGAHHPQSEPAERDDTGGGWLSRLASGLTKSSGKLGQGLTDLLTRRKLDKKALGELEDLLIAADLGPATSARIVKAFGDSELFGSEADALHVRQALARQIADILEPVARPLTIRRPDQGPFVILVCGVNGVGKTTTIGKLAKAIHDRKHHSVMLAAGDTFRAAAVEQLQIWGQRAHAPVVTRDIGADAAALVYEAYEQAKREGVEVLLVDTAGRLHNKTNLMAELQKIVRVLKKHDPALPHEIVLVLDGTTGQNAFSQVETFKEMVNLTGLVVTKLDGSAKGGVVVGLAGQFDLPIYAVGVGEDVEDLQPFTAQGYAKSLVGLG